MPIPPEVFSATYLNLQRLYALRYAAIVGQIVAVLVAVYGFELTLPLLPLVTLLLLLGLFNGLTGWRLRKVRAVGELELFFQLFFDVVLLTAVLFFTGGSTNPFVMLYLVPLALTAASLPQRYTWSMVVLTSSCYGVLMFYFVPLASGHHDHGQVFGLHVMGMWFGFALSAVVIAWFGVRMAQALRDRDAQLAQVREGELRQDKVIALGALAAGAAHELGTPLSTLAIVVDELSVGKPLSAELHGVIADQVQRCKQILNSLSAAAGQVRAQGGGVMPLDQFLETVLKTWQASRPQVTLVTRRIEGKPIPSIISEQTLSQAIVNILNNAADASPQHVEFEAIWDAQRLCIDIADRGAGLAPEIAEQAGIAMLTTKPSGLGLGLFLSFATLERLGGKVTIQNRDGGGVRCQVTLPLSPLIVGQAR